MARYQFFSVPASRRQQYTYVDMASPTFLTEKEALLTQGFEVEEDFIDAATPREAVEKYRSGFLYVADEIGKSDEAYAAATALLEMGKKILGRKAGRRGDTPDGPQAVSVGGAGGASPPAPLRCRVHGQAAGWGRRPPSAYKRECCSDRSDTTYRRYRRRYSISGPS